MWILRQVLLTRRSTPRLAGWPLLFGLAFGLLVAGFQSAISQTYDKEQKPECQADSQSSVDKNRQADSGGSESETSRCKGVLTPPPIGDRGMVEPPPPTGDMPIIRPGDTPQQVPGTKPQ